MTLAYACAMTRWALRAPSVSYCSAMCLVEYVLRCDCDLFVLSVK